MIDSPSISQKIKEYALSIGFDACGICRAQAIDDAEKKHLSNWLTNGYHAGMEYLSRNADKRTDPRLLVDGAKSIISVALNYYPKVKQPPSAPQFAYYAYGKDYHEVVKAKLQKLLEYIKTLLPETQGRVFTDTAPLLKGTGAAKAGLGFVGKNTLLIIPKKGSYFFLGEVVIDAELDYDKPISINCGSCTRCLQACPSQAIEKPHLLNSNKCISYQTIENRGYINKNIISVLNNNIYGCDICQQVCPWNRFATPHSTEEFTPNEEFLSIDYDALAKMTVQDYQRIFKGSAVKREKYAGLMRNLDALKLNQI